MKPQLNHLIVWATDRRAAAELLAELLGLGAPREYDHFSVVETGNSRVGWEIITRPYGSGPLEAA